MADMLAPDLSSYNGASTNRLLAAASNGPEQANVWQTNQYLQTQNQSAQLDLAHKKLGAVYDVASSIMADPTPENGTARITDAVRAGLIDPQMGSEGLAELAGLGGDANKIRQWAFQHAQMAASYRDRMSAAYGDPTLVNQGGQLGVYSVRTGPQGGYGAPQAGANALPITMSPGEKIGRTGIVDPTTGATGSISNGQIYDARGNFIGAGAVGSPAMPQNSPAGGVPARGAATTAPNPQSPPTAATGPSSGVLPTSLSPGQGAAIAGSAETYRNLVSDVASPNGVVNRRGMLTPV